MYETYENLKKLARLYDGSKDLDQATAEYQKTQCPIVFSYIFGRVWQVSYSVVNKFWGVTDEDKASFATEELHKALMDYDEDGQATVQNFFSIYLKRRMYAETKMLQHDKRKANSDAQGYEDMTELFEGKLDCNIELAEVHIDIQGAAELNDRERSYCKIVAETTGVPLRDADVAKMLGISSSAVKQMKDRLATKLAPSLLY